ncbi:helix-turn-helix domain protein [Nitrosococcus halophilus Nc 4]|uniref:Helix-turn-helix domain protein n=1 Tax=Nitrosococcus halophilus (strain Nc4) TaxID=472759 RepID=D5BZK2_NITHN|nr:helix-turn-helix transcriptional regulator [Nitrosococcus halophilus]ADE14297.1 helix-turn-helix domain protein [Nitrosococcus halophilus Nc 4]
MTAQVIKRGERPEWAVIPYEEYLELLEKAEMVEDTIALERAIAAPDDEGVPQDIVERLLEGENPIKVWRTYRGLTQHDLAEQAGLSQSYLAMMEKGEREGTVKALKRIAKALNVDIDDLVDMHDEEPA